MMLLKKVLLITGLLAITYVCTFSQLSQQVAFAMSQVKQNQYSKGTGPFVKSAVEQPDNLIEEASKYMKDSTSKARLFAYELIHQAGKKSKDSNTRQKAVHYLVEACKDKSSGNVGVASQYLQQYKKSDFGLAARDSLASIVKRGSYYLDNLVLLAGYLDINNSVIKTVLLKPKYNDKIKWAAHLALARKGDNEEINYCIKAVKSKEMSDAVIYRLLPGLVYTRQKAAIDYLVTILNSNEKSCLSPNPENPSQIICGYRVMEFLAPVIKDFPLQLIEGVNQIKTDNYETALETARKWFKEHGNNYEIKTDTF